MVSEQALCLARLRLAHPGLAHPGLAHSIGEWPPAWQFHPDVLVILGTCAFLWVIAARKWAPVGAPGQSHGVTLLQRSSFALAMVTLWFASDWPVHDVAEGSLYSVHMIQHTLYSLVAAPLLLLGTPGWMLRRALGPAIPIVRRLGRFFPGLAIFNVVLVVTHWPQIVNLAITNHPFHFLVHVIVLSSALVMWMPVLSPLPEVPRVAPPARMLYLFLQSMLPTVPASFLTFGTTPLYSAYEHFVRPQGVTALSDQQMAGLVMKVGAGTLIWAVIAVVFFKWNAEEERAVRPSVRTGGGNTGYGVGRKGVGVSGPVK